MKLRTFRPDDFCPGGYLVHLRMLSSIPGLCSSDANCTPPTVWQPKISLDIVKCPLRGMLLLGNNNKIVLYSLLIVNIFLFQESLLSPLPIFLPPLGPTPRDHAECSISEMLNLNTSFYKIPPNFPYISIFHSFIIKHLFSIYSFSIYY